ncbi:MAG: DUF3416 domain-containing protein, partial [Noviherbaspirillum sp.]
MTMAPPSSASFLPRIYFLRLPVASLASEYSQLETHLGRCAGLGFDHVLLSPPADAGAVERMAKLCASQGLGLLLDVAPAGPGETLLHSNPAWFASDDPDPLPDPRKPPGRPAPRPLLEREEVAAGISRYWQEQLAAWTAAGVAGFRCLALARAPASFWRALIGVARAANPDSHFLAWTPGCSPQALQALEGCGFDASFSSQAWWDYRSRWLVEEYERLLRIAPPVAFPDPPGQAVLARLPGYDALEARRRIFRRALFLAAATGNGLLVPMGFEYGLSYPAAAYGRDGPGFEWLRTHAALDLSEEIREANGFVAGQGAQWHRARLSMPGGVQSGLALLLRQPMQEGGEALLVAANADTAHPLEVAGSQLLERTGGLVRQQRLWPGVGPQAAWYASSACGPT